MAAIPVQKTKKAMSRNKKTVIKFFCYISPWLFGLLVFTALPMLVSLFLSFTSAKVATMTSKPIEFVGLENFKWLFTQDDAFVKSIGNTFFYAVVRVALGVICSVLLAVLFNKDIYGKKLFRTMLYAPSLVPVVASTLIWRLLITQDKNLLSNFLGSIGIYDFDALSKETAMLTVIFISLINGVGPTMIVVLAALQGVPQELEEAAIIDGASSVRIFWHITIPMISSSLMFISLTGFIGALQAYADIKLLTGGGPQNATITMAMCVVSNAFAMDSFGVGYACSQAWIVFVFILIFSLIYFSLLKKKVYYGD
ncbi:MAG: carbohydrate ABC transporter permease [Candidatus Scatosoma sp.]